MNAMVEAGKVGKAGKGVRNAAFRFVSSRAGWGRSAGARRMARIAFGEIARRRIPADVFVEAFSQLMGEDSDAE
jgi:hypothetical protein